MIIASQTTTGREFQVQCERADHVYLLVRAGDSASRILPMQRDAASPGRWWLRLDLLPGRYAFRVYCETDARLTWCSAPALETGDEQIMEPVAAD